MGHGGVDLDLLVGVDIAVPFPGAVLQLHTELAVAPRALPEQVIAGHIPLRRILEEGVVYGQFLHLRPAGHLAVIIVVVDIHAAQLPVIRDLHPVLGRGILGVQRQQHTVIGGRIRRPVRCDPQIVAPAHSPAVPEGVVQIDPPADALPALIGVVPAVPDVVPVLHNGPVDVDDLLELLRLRLVSGKLDLVVPQIHHLHLRRVRHPPLRAEDVHTDGPAHQRRAHAHRSHPGQTAPEHPQGLLQQHGGHIVPQHAGQGHAHPHRDHEGVVPIVEQGHAQQLVEQAAQGQAAQKGRAVAEHGPQPPEGHHVPGPLAVAAAAELPRQRQQDQPYQGIEGHHPEADEVWRALPVLYRLHAVGKAVVDGKDGREELGQGEVVKADAHQEHLR